MPIRDSYQHGTPSWVDLATTDPEAAKEFYGALFGWTFDDTPMDDAGTIFYSMASLDGHRVAAIAPQQTEQTEAGVPPHWQMYITVDDVEVATQKVSGAGGTVLGGPFDVFDAGRMSVVQDPVGAVVCLWQPRAMPGAELINETGAFVWDELIAPNSASAAPFYETVVGLKLTPSDMGNGQIYNGWTLDGTDATMIGGATDPPMPEIPPHWSIYFASADVDADAATTKQLGGTVMVEPFDIPVGRMTVLADPQGAVFNLIHSPPSE